MSRLKDFEKRIFTRLRRPAPKGWMQRSTFWLLLICALSGLLGLLPGVWGDVFLSIAELLLFPLVVLSVLLLIRYIFGRFLWKVRNRLIVTYVLIGMTPFVLFFTLANLSLYVFSGQFAIFASVSAEHAELGQIAAENRIFASRLAQEVMSSVPRGKLSLPGIKDMAAMRGFPDMRLAVFVDGQQVEMQPADLNAGNIAKVPGWVRGKNFEGIVFDNGHLYLRAINRATAGSHQIAVISSLPMGQKNVDRIAAGLGSVTIFPTAVFGNQKELAKERQEQAEADSEDQAPDKLETRLTQEANKAKQSVAAEPLNPPPGEDALVGGQMPRAQHFYDLPVGFAAPLETINWQTGRLHLAFERVHSRPSLLYQRLFITSLRVGNIYRDALIGLTIFFTLLEVLAFYVAMRLNRTITKSIRDLYSATQAIDRGDFEHRIVVKRRDQLAALSQSFNNMTASLARLLKEQEEKQKMQGELVIAQEVQANLFPGADLQLGPLEVHGICLPARTVSGDYYDFLVLGEKALGLALGDISGKGISAALLMATLHSAVRAYRYAGNEMALAAQHMLAKAGKLSPEFEAESGRLFTQPASMLRLLNQHLYRSTQPEKYATLFLAHLEVETRQLTYANGGQLPPLLLRTNGSVDRMDKGGTVVGLIDNVSYEQGVETMQPGDILIAYSDGVTEPENDFGDFGEERLVELVERHRHLPLDLIANQVMHALRGWIGEQEQPDDITLVLARYGHTTE